MKTAVRIVVALLAALVLLTGISPIYQPTSQVRWQIADPNPPEGG